jgi:four helix bundle protein
VSVIKSFRDLEVYRIGLEQAKKIFAITKSFPSEERYSLTDQIRRSSRAVNGMVAEGWARRRYPASFVNKINEAMGEAMETQAWLDHALSCNYITRTQFSELDDAWQHIGAMLNRMIERADHFCKLAGKHKGPVDKIKPSSILNPLSSILDSVPSTRRT